jgi:hypothetical protein
MAKKVNRKMNWNIVIKEEDKIVDSFSVNSESNLMALLQAQRVFLNKHKDYELVDCGMWMDKDTTQRDLYVDVPIPVGYVEKYFSIEIK